jgi:hypothetical protein
MLTLEERRHQANMHMVYKIMNGYGGLYQRHGLREPPTTPFTLHNHNQNSRVKAGRLEVRRNFSSGRVVNDWNRIPFEARNRRTTMFKAACKKTRVFSISKLTEHRPGEIAAKERVPWMRYSLLQPYLDLGGSMNKYQVSIYKSRSCTIPG